MTQSKDIYLYLAPFETSSFAGAEAAGFKATAV
jgi:hypothetical protein